ncbi:hypothetical protein E2C01_032608 [Portunus trituberculatus]|uniref:Uncharacterized protein n=1 Tax=Portunus trituberculatus TaxID=210409 RepID=A0A5B7F1I0_PORTR|nr:hypothetical protein [Portunus trituberculatus]
MVSIAMVLRREEQCNRCANNPARRLSRQCCLLVLAFLVTHEADRRYLKSRLFKTTSFIKTVMASYIDYSTVTMRQNKGDFLTYLVTATAISESLPVRPSPYILSRPLSTNYPPSLSILSFSPPSRRPSPLPLMLPPVLPSSPTTPLIKRRLRAAIMIGESLVSVALTTPSSHASSRKVWSTPPLYPGSQDTDTLSSVSLKARQELGTSGLPAGNTVKVQGVLWIPTALVAQQRSVP